MAKDRKDEERTMEQPVTYEAYAEMPDDGYRYEIFDGKLEMMTPGPSVIHQGIGGELHFILKKSCDSDFLVLGAPLDVILSRTNVLQPDLIMVHRSRTDIVTVRGIEGAPDLVVEIVSPGSRKRDKIKKPELYARFQVPEYWIIDPETRSMEQYLLMDEGRYDIHGLYEGDDPVFSDKLPCVSFAISDLFRDENIRKLISSN